MSTITSDRATENIERDLASRASVSENLSNQASSTSPQQQREAFDTMSASRSSSGSDLPKVMLVGNDNGGADSLKGAEVKTGGYNALVGAKVPAGAVGIETKLGRVYPEPLQPGWHWKNPLAHVEMMSTRLIADTVKAQASSHDLQQVTTELTVPFSIKPESGPAIYSKIGNVDKIEEVVINPGVLESVKAVAAKYTAEQLVTKREEVKTLTEELLKDYINTTLQEKGIPGAINVGNIAITHFNFSDDFNHSIELKVKAEQDALRAENEKKQKVTEAEAYRDSEKAKADGDAYSTKVKAQAEADAIKIRAEALKTNPKVVDLEAVKKWDGKLPVYTGNNPVPFINGDKLKEAGEQKK